MFKEKIIDFLKEKVNILDKERVYLENKNWTHIEEYLITISKIEGLCDICEYINKMEDKDRSLHNALNSFMELGYFVQFSSTSETSIDIFLSYKDRRPVYKTLNTIEFKDEGYVIKVLTDLFIKMHSI